MAKRQNDMAQLAKLTRAAFQVRQAKLQKKAEAEARLQHEIDKLDAARETVLKTLSLEDGRTPAQITSHAVWLTWANRQRAGLNMALASARAAAMQEREAAKKAFGSDQVAQKLQTKK